MATVWPIREDLSFLISKMGTGLPEVWMAPEPRASELRELRGKVDIIMIGELPMITHRLYRYVCMCSRV